MRLCKLEIVFKENVLCKLNKNCKIIIFIMYMRSNL